MELARVSSVLTFVSNDAHTFARRVVIYDGACKVSRFLVNTLQLRRSN